MLFLTFLPSFLCSLSEPAVLSYLYASCCSGLRWPTLVSLFQCQSTHRSNLYILLTFGHTFLGHFVLALCSAASWMLSAGPGSAGNGYWPPFSSYETTSEVPCLVLASPVQNKSWTYWRKSHGRPPSVQWTGAEDVWEVERSEIEVKWREGHWGILRLSATTYWKGIEKSEPDSFQRYMATEEASDTIWNIWKFDYTYLGRQESPWLWSNTDTNCPQRL